jgi:hypothetical protein
MINLYGSFHVDYGWTQQEIDNTDLDYLLDLLVVKDKIENGEEVEPISYIDGVL